MIRDASFITLLVKYLSVDKSTFQSSPLKYRSQLGSKCQEAYEISTKRTQCRELKKL